MHPELPPQPDPDPNTLARAQARLLAALSRLGGEPTADGDASSHVSWLGPQADWEAGRDEPPVTDRYRFGPVFARGGLGAVRRAEDRKLGRTVAVKELLRFDDRAIQRFVREAAITARLQHPGIVPLYDLGRDAAGRPFLCMKLVEGASLEQRIAACPKLEDRVALIGHVVAAAEAIAFAHRRGVIHRDLKPANILVGELGEAVVIDWGLAKDLSQETDLSGADERDEGDISDLTAAGSLLGTLRYMPPEQARGDAVDARSDIYALGAVLYHVLAGVAPFHDLRSARLASAVLEGRPRPLAAHAPGVAPALVAIVEKAMAKPADRRYAAAEAFADDLRRFQAGLLVGAHAYSLAEVGRLWLRRHRAVAAVAAASVVALGVLGGVALVRVDAARDVAETQRAAAVTSQAAAEQRAQEAEDARTIADRRAEDLLLAQVRLAIEVDPSQALRLLGELAPDPSRAGAVRVLATAAWSQGGVGATMTGPSDELVQGIRLADGTWLARTTRELWRWRPGAQAGEKLGPAAILAATPDGTTWAAIAASGDRGAEVTLHRDGVEAPTRVSLALASKPAFYHWRLHPGGDTLAGYPLGIDWPVVHVDLRTGAALPLPGPDAPRELIGLQPFGSDDGRMLAAIRDHRTLIVWDRETGALSRTALPGEPLLALANWTPDGRAFAVPCRADFTARAPDLMAEHVLIWRRDGAARVVEASWARAARDAVVFIAHRGGATTAWAEDLGGRRMWTRAVHIDAFDDFVATPNTSRDGRLVRWSFGIASDVVEVATGTLLHSERRSLTAAPEADNGGLLARTADGYIATAVADIAWRALWPATTRNTPLDGLTTAGDWAIVRAADGVARLDLRTGTTEPLPTRCGPWSPSHTVLALAADGRALTLAHGGAACLWGHDRSDILEIPRRSPTAAALASDGRVALAFPDDAILTWTTPDAAPQKLPLTGYPHDLRWSPDASVLAALGGAGDLTIFTRDGHPHVLVDPVPGDERVPSAMTFAPAGATVAVYRRGQPEIEVIDIAADTRTTLTGAAPATEGDRPMLAYSPSGRSLALLDGDLLQRWSSTTPDAPVRLDVPRGSELAFLDEDTLVVVGERGELEIVDPASGTHAPLRAAAGGRGRPHITRSAAGLVLLAGSGEVLRFSDTMPAAIAPQLARRMPTPGF